MTSLHFNGNRVPHPAVGMVGRSLTRQAMSGDLRVASDSPTWKVHYFARGIFHWQFGAHDLRLEPGNWLVIPPGVKHGGLGDLRECGSFYWLHLLTDQGAWPGFTPDEMTTLATYIQPGVHRGRDHTELWQQLVDILQGDGPFRDGRCALAMGNILHTCFQDMSARDEASATADHMQRVCDWIEAHLDEPLSTNFLARLAGLSRTRFIQCFREATGSAPASYIHGRRMEQACHLLKRHRQSILEVALEVGFSSSQAFATTFKQSYGVTPTQWRRSQRASQ